MMKRKRSLLAGLMTVLLLAPLGLRAQAFGLGDIKLPGIKLPGSSSTSSDAPGSRPDMSGAARKQRKNNKVLDYHYPFYVEKGKDIVYNQLNTNIVVSGRLLRNGKPLKEKQICVCPSGCTREGKFFKGCFYGYAHTDTEGYFHVRALPGTYKLYYYVKGTTLGLFADTETRDLHDKGPDYEITDFGVEPEWVDVEI